MTSAIRPTIPEDTPALLAITEGTGLFSRTDIADLDWVLREYHKECAAQGHRCVTYDQAGQIAGYAYWAEAEMTDRAWYLWWIAVSKQTQARGIGGALLRHVEADVRAENGRLLLIETSGLPSYELTRKFYVKQGYEVGAVLKDYYADDHDMVTYRKRLASDRKQ